MSFLNSIHILAQEASFLALSLFPLLLRQEASFLLSLASLPAPTAVTYARVCVWFVGGWRWNVKYTLCCANTRFDGYGYGYGYIALWLGYGIWIWNGRANATAPTQSEAELCRFQGSRAESLAWLWLASLCVCIRVKRFINSIQKWSASIAWPHGSKSNRNRDGTRGRGSSHCR